MPYLSKINVNTSTLSKNLFHTLYVNNNIPGKENTYIFFVVNFKQFNTNKSILIQTPRKIKLK